jgi:hypothetical protein
VAAFEGCLLDVVHFSDWGVCWLLFLDFHFCEQEAKGSLCLWVGLSFCAPNSTPNLNGTLR